MNNLRFCRSKETALLFWSPNLPQKSQLIQ